MRKNDYLIVVVLSLCFIVFIGCDEIDTKDNEEVREPKELFFSDEINPELSGEVQTLEAIELEMEDYAIVITGITWHKSTGDVLKDVEFAGTGLLNEVFESGFERGLQFGFQNQKKEVANRDAYLSIYLTYGFDDEVVSQRDSIIPKLKIQVIDDQEDEGILIFDSQKDKYVDLSYPYSVMVYKVYSDTESFIIELEDYLLETNISTLK